MNEVIIITPVATELLDRETEVKPYLKVNHDDENELIDLLISSARDQIERWCGVGIGSQVREWTFDHNSKPPTYNPYPTAAEAKRNQDWIGGEQEVEIPYGPVISVDTVTYKNDNTYDDATEDTDYFIDGNLFKAGANRWKVTYTGGYTTLPHGLKLIWLQYIAFLYLNRGNESVEMPQQIKYALNPYKRSLI